MMKKTYIAPAITIVCVQLQQMMIAGSSEMNVLGNTEESSGNLSRRGRWENDDQWND